MTARRRSGSHLARAFDELTFGSARTLDLRSSLPTGAEAERRVEAWLRERQVSDPNASVLIVTGRGRGSVDGVPVVRPAVERRIARLRRQGVVRDVRVHGPGAFVVTLAPVGAVLAAPPRRRDPRPPRGEVEALAGLAPETLSVLRELARHTLESLGAPLTEPLVKDEMARQFSRLAAGLGAGRDREARLRAAAAAALRELLDS